MTDPQPEEPGRPLSRRELREQAAARNAVRPEPDEAAVNGQGTAQPPGRRTLSEISAEGEEAAPSVVREGAIESLFEEAAPASRRRRGRGCLIALIVVIVIIGGIAAGGVWAWNVYGERIQEALGIDGPHDYEEGEATGEATVTIEEGDTGEALSPKLHEAGVTLEADSFTRYLREEGLSPTLYPGVYQLQRRMTSAAALEALEDPANRLEHAAQLREGLTVDASIEVLAEGLELPVEDFESAVSDPGRYGVEGDSLEGWLFPATYTFEPEATAEEVIRRLVDRTRESLDSAGVPDDQVHEVLTIASVIQREARFEDDFYRVSRVIHNRLSSDTWGDTNGLLQMDSTTQYGFGEEHSGSASTSAEARDDDNPWNTYMHPGLPVGPISNPGDLAIDAAMNPADGPWLYFVTVNLNTGETKFATSFGEHEQNVDEWRSWCVDNPDAGC